MSLEAVREAFVSRFGEPPEIVTRAPGRVNLIGEHTDAHEGFVFPAAIDRFVWLAASRTNEHTDLHSLEFETNEWTAYPNGVAWAFAERGIEVPNLRGLVTSDVPIGAGISSSAALEMAFAVAWNELEGLSLPAIELALLGQRCENGFVGVQCGLMDQMASACGLPGNAMFFDTLSREVTYCTLPEELAIVVADTTKSRELTSSKYNERREDCEEAARALGVRALRHATLGELEDAADLMSEVAFRRTRHVITEIRRCLDFGKALESRNFARLDDLMRGSHASLRDDYEASCLELDAMAEACNAAPGCIGARMTGAGFGGACVALVLRSTLSLFLEEASRTYFDATGLTGRLMRCEATHGAQRIA
jgi:galactokinase